MEEELAKRKERRSSGTTPCRSGPSGRIVPCCGGRQSAGQVLHSGLQFWQQHHVRLTPRLDIPEDRRMPYGILSGERPREDFVRKSRGRRIHELKHKDRGSIGEPFTSVSPGPWVAAGECSLCVPRKPCAVLKGKECVHPLRARPAMEACGFDVFAIARKVGWNLVPVGHSSTPQNTPCASLISWFNYFNWPQRSNAAQQNCRGNPCGCPILKRRQVPLS
jgi:hypothetical protein